MAAKKPVKRKHVKNVRKTKKQRARNVREKNLLKATMKAARLAVSTKAADVLEMLKKAASVLDKAAERGIIHANKAARLKSRLNLAHNKTK